MGEDERPTPDQASPVSLALAWATGACAAVFVALVALPSAFVLAGLLRSGDASVAARLSLLPGVLAVAWHPNAWSDDPVRAATTAAGLLAGVACVLMAAAMAAQRGRGRRLVEPLAAQRAYLVCLAGLAVSAGCLLAASFVLPVPARPLEWWMLAIGLALPTAWLAARRLWAWPAVVMLAAAQGCSQLPHLVVRREPAPRRPPAGRRSTGPLTSRRWRSR